jgi:hypothetical protein
MGVHEGLRSPPRTPIFFGAFSAKASARAVTIQ